MPGTYVKSAIIFSIKDADEMKRNVSLQGHFSQFHVVILFLGGDTIILEYDRAVSISHHSLQSCDLQVSKFTVFFMVFSNTQKFRGF